MTADRWPVAARGDPLEELRELADELGASDIAGDARSLATRVADGRFYVACVGQFKRGKSTLLNALIGRELLPTGVVPVTAIITIVRHGLAFRSVVHFDDGREEIVEPPALASFISEEQNPENQKRVRAVEVFAPSELLASGMCLVDTPGLGSAVTHNTETTRAFLPHVDAALVVSGADPPISGEEVAITEALAGSVPAMLFVLNKADRLTERDVAEAGAFARRLLQARMGSAVELFTVSATEKLEGGTTRDWSALEAALYALARDAGAGLVRAAEARGVRRIAGHLLAEIDLRREALRRPLEESEMRVTMLRRTIDDARRALADLGYLFTAEQHRLSRAFEEERAGFLADAIPLETRRIGKLAHEAGGHAPSRESALEATEGLAEMRVHAWLEQVEPRAEALYSAATERFVMLAQDFVRRVGAAGVSERADEIGTEPGLRKKRGFFFTSIWAATSRPPGAGMIRMLLPARRRRERVLRECVTYLERLLESNSARVANDLTERVLESRRRLESEVRSVLDRAASSAERALERARESRDQGAAAVAREVEALDAMRARVEALLHSATIADEPPRAAAQIAARETDQSGV